MTFERIASDEHRQVVREAEHVMSRLVAPFDSDVELLLRVAIWDLRTNVMRASLARTPGARDRSWDSCQQAEGAIALALGEARRRGRLARSQVAATSRALVAARRHRSRAHGVAAVGASVPTTEETT